MIELLIVIAIIGILAAIAIPMYQAQTLKARLTEVTNAVSNVASGLTAFRNENGGWPQTCGDVQAINNTLGVGVSIAASARVGNMAVNAATGAITASGIKNVGNPVDGSSLVMTPTIASSAEGGGITWDFNASTVPVAYRPRK